MGRKASWRRQHIEIMGFMGSEDKKILPQLPLNGLTFFVWDAFEFKAGHGGGPEF